MSWHESFEELEKEKKNGPYEVKKKLFGIVEPPFPNC